MEESEIQLSLRVSWKRKRNEFGDTILIVKIHKDGLVFRIEDRERNSKITINIWSDYFKQILQSIKEVRLFPKQTDCRERNWHHGRNWMDPKDSSTTSIINGIILVVLICYLRRIRFRKSRVLYGLLINS